MNIKELLIMWLDNYEKDRVKTRTYSRYKSIIELHLIPEFGNFSINELKRRRIQEFLSNKKKYGNLRSGKTLSSSSTNLILTVLSMAFEYAIDMEFCENNPCLRLKRIPNDCKQVEAFTREEQKKIELYINNSNDRKLFGILLGLYSGMRIGELIALEWNDIDFNKNIIHVNKTVYRDKNKTGKWELCIDKPKSKSSERVIPLPTCIVELLKKHNHDAKSNYVVENKKGERMSIRSYQYIFETLTKKVSIRKPDWTTILSSVTIGIIVNHLSSVE